MPAAYCGFETLVESLGQRLAARGHEVPCTAGRTWSRADYASYKGMRLVYIPRSRNKYLDTIVHTLLCTLHMAFAGDPTWPLYFIAGNSPFAGLSATSGRAQHHQRGRAGLAGEQSGTAAPSAYLRWAERNAPRFANAHDHRLARCPGALSREYHAETSTSPTARSWSGEDSGEWLERFGLEPDATSSSSGAWCPRTTHTSGRGVRGPRHRLKLVVVGDAPYADEYQAALHATKDERVLFTGYILATDTVRCCRNAAHLRRTDGGRGTHPVIVEAMAAGNCVVVNDYEPEPRDDR